jgi:hypothetical protein
MRVEELTLVIITLVILAFIIMFSGHLFKDDQEKHKLRMVDKPKKDLNGKPAYIDINRKDYTFLNYAVDNVNVNTHPTDVITAVKKAIFVGMSSINHDAVKCHLAVSSLSITYKYINGNSDWKVSTPYENLYVTNKLNHSQHAVMFYKMYLLGQSLAMHNFDTEYVFLQDQDNIPV